MYPPRIFVRCFDDMPLFRLRQRQIGLVAVAAGAVFALASAPVRADVLITVNKSTQRMTVEVDGATRWNWPVSTGRPGYDTPNGHYTAFRMEADHYSKEWDDAPMPHSIFFTKLGHAIHGYLDTRHIGSPASHGCVRLDDANATKLYQVVEEEGMTNAKVVVTGDVEAALARGKPSREAAADDASNRKGAGTGDTGKLRIAGPTTRAAGVRHASATPRQVAYRPPAVSYSSNPTHYGYAQQYRTYSYRPYQTYQYGF